MIPKVSEYYLDNRWVNDTFGNWILSQCIEGPPVCEYHLEWFYDTLRPPGMVL